MGTRLFIGNLSYNVNEQELREAFSSEGIEVRSVRVSLDRETGRPRGFAFVETLTDEGAKASIEKLSGRILQGRPIVVEEAQARPAGGGPGGSRPSGPSGPPRPGGFGGAPGGPPRPGGFGGAPSGPPRPGGFGGPPGGPPRPGGFGGPPRSFGPPPPAGPAPPAGERRRDRPEKKKSTRPKPEEQERGNWRWDGGVDED
ncbi:MAG: RNA-binding protein [Deltaproteobacteria bacterium]|nr:RNA-binding protein [Deltaproteobacteria bacterium]